MSEFTRPIGVPKDQILASRLTLNPGMRPFYRMLGQRTKRKLIGVGLGASTWEGSVADPNRQISCQLEKMLQNSYNPAGVTGGYSLKCRNAGVAGALGWVKSGSSGEILDQDTKKLSTLAAGTTATHTTFQPSTGLDIFFPSGPTVGAFTVTIDGGAPITVTPSSTEGYTEKWSSGVLTRQVHTYVITATSATVIGLTYIRDQDENYGLRLYNFGRAGGATTQFVDSTADSTWARITSMQPDFFTLMLGHNNLGATTVAQMQTDLGIIADRAAAIDTTKKVPILVMAQHSTDSRWPAFHAGIKAFAQTRGLPFASFYDFFAKDTTAATTSGDYYTDNLHLINEGHDIAALAVADQWQLPSRKTFAVTP
ncbi:SGNH/GDSL hydrolase family protein [Rhodococcus sp. KRD162]|uniref:SGNH/GDSL hydrolase family protein n=1 Tax=Rhodococcus sp. KRD162 TaxID=2729725 RepID=UPI0019D0CCFF|nr:SGNH/GDSL hydrolase family protein [Rhodococcus sp. KRD162]